MNGVWDWDSRRAFVPIWESSAGWEELNNSSEWIKWMTVYKSTRNLLFFSLYFSGILLCTDVMARGIDVPHIDWVIQCDPPTNAK